jgi:hypothetical protein
MSAESNVHAQNGLMIVGDVSPSESMFLHYAALPPVTVVMLQKWYSYYSLYSVIKEKKEYERVQMIV